jgi:putative monooxygenase
MSDLTVKVTKVSITDIQPNRRRGGDIRALLSPSTTGSTSGFMGALMLQPGEYVSEHYHPYSEEFLYVVSGWLEAKVDGELIRLRSGDALMIPTGSRHRMENNGETPVFAIFHLGPLAPEPRLGHVDTEPLPNPDAPNPSVAD